MGRTMLARQHTIQRQPPERRAYEKERELAAVPEIQRDSAPLLSPRMPRHSRQLVEPDATAIPTPATPSGDDDPFRRQARAPEKKAEVPGTTPRDERRTIGNEGKVGHGSTAKPSISLT